MTPDEKTVPAARLIQLAWLVRQTRCAQRRARTSLATDRAIAEQHERRLDAAVAVILGDQREDDRDGKGGAA